MSRTFRSSLRNNAPYIPKSISDLKEFLAKMMLFAPTFHDETGYFPDDDIDTAYASLDGGLDLLRKTIGEDRYVALRDLSARSKALFAADQHDDSGKTDEGRALLFEIEDILIAAGRRRRKPPTTDDGSTPVDS